MFSDFLPSLNVCTDIYLFFIGNKLICVKDELSCKQDTRRDILVDYIVFLFFSIFAGI